MDTRSVDLPNTEFAEALYQAWLVDRNAVPAEWAAYFDFLDASDGAGAANPPPTPGAGNLPPASEPAPRGRPAAETAANVDYAHKQSRVDSLIWAHREVGYLYADINPLRGYITPELWYMMYSIEGDYGSLELSHFGLSDADLDTEFYVGKYMQPAYLPLREILERLKQIYCAGLGAEFLHIQNRVVRRWIIERMESDSFQKPWPAARRIAAQNLLIQAEEFERFIHANFIGQKRFSLEGGEALIPAIGYLINAAADHRLEEIVFGMAHRGRLNVFVNALGKPAIDIFAKFEDNYKPHVYGGSGDVKYHLGFSRDCVDEATGKSIHVSLVANPSHLEAVNPVVEGKTRAIQRRRGDRNRKRVLPVLIHGDAAFSGQGVVTETLNLSQLKGYRTGGTIHIIINNQIGFTTASRDARSTFFATDNAKIVPIPIFHVNGDDADAVLHAVDMALRFRQKFAQDVIVDILCYRRLGHNEADEPSFTHPRMYDMINNHESAPTVFGKKLAAVGVYDLEAQDAYRAQYRASLADELAAARAGYQPTIDDAYQGDEWSHFSRAYSFDAVVTGFTRERLAGIARAITTVPEGFNLHAKLQRFVADRRKAFFETQLVDWSLAEALAFGSLLEEGYTIRMSGEDCGRGTFSQRHAVWWDVLSPVPRSHVALRTISAGQAWFSIYDSPLSEFSVLGFDYGYSLALPNSLVVWEAQFGDFVNGAQVIIDQFIAAGESKWFRSSGLVMLLPHGYEGQGPEHSSAHLSRFLLLCADDNLQVVNCTTPAQYFHVLRRQMLQPFRKPLVIMTPKSLLRSKLCLSPVADLVAGEFATIIDDAATGGPAGPAGAAAVGVESAGERTTDTAADSTGTGTGITGTGTHDPGTHDAGTSNAAAVRRLFLCSGKVYYDLYQERAQRDVRDVAIVRIEQLYPFDAGRLARILSRYPGLQAVAWVQEEAKNYGAWSFVAEQIRRVYDGPLRYVGRPAGPSPATGSFRQHQAELRQLLDEAFA